jgi:hypothetical protein
MTGQEKIRRAYRIEVRPPLGAGDGYHVRYAPRGLQQVRENGSFPQVPAAFEAVARIRGEEVAVGWANPPNDPEATRENFDQDAAGRVRLLDDWLARLGPLVRSVEVWAQELGWATRVVEKPMEDSQIGEYKAPGLLMQEGVNRILLEPVGRSAPGTEGVVDLYLMPAYDDIASLYFYDGRWNLHYAPAGTAAVATVREAPSKPLSKETLEAVLAEMRQHAA